VDARGPTKNQRKNWPFLTACKTKERYKRNHFRLGGTGGVHIANTCVSLQEVTDKQQNTALADVEKTE